MQPSVDRNALVLGLGSLLCREVAIYGLVGILAGWTECANAQVVIPETYALPMDTADASQPGFFWNIFQNGANQTANIARVEAALAGILADAAGNLLPNLADPDAVGIASGPGVKLGAKENAVLQFAIPTVINVDQVGGSQGNIIPDDPMPGVPGLGESAVDDGIAVEVLTWLNLPVGTHTLIVNSDDGFRLSIGGAAPGDKLGQILVGEFNAGRGVATDTVMEIQVTKAGLYATRLLWMAGCCGANLEFVQVLPDGRRVAVNADDSTIQAYREATAALPAYVSKLLPLPNDNRVPFDAPVEVELTGVDVDPTTVRLILDGAPVDSEITQAGDITKVRYRPTAVFPSESDHVASIVLGESSDRNFTWNFKILPYAYLTPDLKVGGDPAQPGFIWNVYQNSTLRDYLNWRPLTQLAGTLAVNHADPSVQGVALAPGTVGAHDRVPVRFEIETVLNVDQASGDQGEFVPDDQMPGIPGVDEAELAGGIAGEVLTYIDLPAGITTLIFNSGCDFVTTAGNVFDLLDRKVAAQFSGFRATAGDTFYRVYAQEAGTYLFRTVWQTRSSNASLEWKLLKADGSRVLLNDVANDGPRTFRAATDLSPATITRISPAPGDSEVPPHARFEIVIEEGSTAVDLSSIALQVDGQSVAALPSKNEGVVTVTYDPPADFQANTAHTARLTFRSGEQQRIAEWSFAVPRVTRDTVHGYFGAVLGAAAFTPEGGGQSGQPGDFAMDFGTQNGSSVHVPNIDFLKAAAAADELTFSHWQKLHAVVNSQAFSIVSPGSNEASHGWQAHVPWTDGVVYFDNSGCCIHDVHRISKAIDEQPGYTDETWWHSWRHFVFIKKADGTKQIWIDGELFHEGISGPLRTDWVDMYIGSRYAVERTMHGVVDDLAVFGKALTEAQVKALFSGTRPEEVAGDPDLLALWDFNDAEPAGTVSTISIEFGTSGISVSYTGVLQAASSVEGPYTDVPDATNPYSETPSGTRYFRSRQ